MNFIAFVDSLPLCRPGKATLIKLLHVMKITIFFILSACLQVSATGKAQDRITFSGKELPMEKVFQIIKKQTSYSFFYNDKQMEGAKKITISCKNATIEEVLAVCFKDQPFDYTIKGKTIFIIIKKDSPKNDRNIIVEDSKESIDVKGRVVNDKGEALAGVTVKIKGSDVTTTTNENGEFILKSVSANAVLIFSHITMETFEQKVRGNTELLVKLRTKLQELAEVEVMMSTGYQDIPKERATGSFVKIGNELINRKVSTNILDRILEVTSGVILNPNVSNSTSGLVQAKSQNIQIRGVSTINADKSPAIIVDNFPFEGDLYTINPNDVENITVLKDAAAASIWGVRAGNGVIVITTKKGKFNQRPRVSVISNVTCFEKPNLFYYPIASSKDIVEFELKLFADSIYNIYDDSYPQIKYFPVLSPAVETMLAARHGQITKSEANEQIDYYKKQDVRDDIKKYFVKKRVNQQYALNVSGGSSNYNYFGSIGFDRNSGYNIGDLYRRLTLRFDNSWRPIKQLEVNTYLVYTQTMDEFGGSDFNSLMPGFVVPYDRLVDESGNARAIANTYRTAFADTASSPALLDWHYKPFDEINSIKTNRSKFDARFGGKLKYNVLPSFNVEVVGQYQKIVGKDNTNRSIRNFYTRNLINRFMTTDAATGNPIYPVPLGDIVNVANSEQTNWNLRTQANFYKKWYKHNVVILAGIETRQDEIIISGLTNYGFDPNLNTSKVVDFVNQYITYFGTKESIPSGMYSNKLLHRFGSYYANGAYTLCDKYTISGSARIDKSNFFGVQANQRKVPLWSTGLSWELSKENWYYENVHWMPYLRMRGSFGFNGNTNPGASAYATIKYSQTPNPIGNLSFAQIVTPNNPELRWEKVQMVNIGIDFGSQRNFVSGSIEYYFKKGLDLIGPIQIDPTTGFSVFTGNRASINGKGVDVQLNTLNSSSKSFKWVTNVNFSYNSDKVTSFGEEIVKGTVLAEDANRPVVGQPLYKINAFKWAGLNDQDGSPQIYVNNVAKGTGSYNQITPSDIVYLGPSIPNFFGSLRNTFAWNHFELSVNITFKFKYFFRRPSVSYTLLYQQLSTHADFTYRWKKPGDEAITNVPSLPSTQDAVRDRIYQYSDILVEKGDHVRLQDIKFSYSLNKENIKRFPFQGVQVYLYADNLGILWRANKYNIDPDFSTAYSFPNSKSISVGININL